MAESHQIHDSGHWYVFLNRLQLTSLSLVTLCRIFFSSHIKIVIVIIALVVIGLMVITGLKTANQYNQK